MKRFVVIFFILALCCTKLNLDFQQAQTTWYVSTTGNDATGAGTADNPWRTIYKAANDPSLNEGDMIYVAAGSYTEVHQIELPNLVSVRGAGIDQTIIHSTVSGPLFKLESYNHWGDPLYGNQTISYLTLDGDLTGTSAITVNFRSNVQIHHCKIIDFSTDGVYFWGQPEAAWTGTHPFESWKDMPSVWCSGNKVLNCIISNNAVYVTGVEGKGNIRYGQQDGFEVSNCTITQTGRAAGSNGYGIKFYHEGFNRNTNIHDNTITVAPRESGKFNFSIENWNDIGGCQYYNNTLQGQLDLTGTINLTGTYGSWVHHNHIGFSSTPTNTEVGVTPEEITKNCIISDNHFYNLTQAIVIQELYPLDDHPVRNVVEGVHIYNNLIERVGESSTGGRWTYGSIAAIAIEDYNCDYRNTVDDIYIYNNTIVSSGIVRSNTYMSVGILIYGAHTINNIQIKNNIIQGFTGATTYNAPIMACGGAANTNLSITYNNFYGNGNSNAPLYNNFHCGAFSPGAGYVYSNTLTTSPALGTDFKLTSSSPGIYAGTNVGLTTDQDGISYYNPPSMGCFEYGGFVATAPTVITSVVSSVTTTTAACGGNVTSAGTSAVTARGVCYGTSANPTLSNNYTSNGTGIGVFSSFITGLTNSTTYYVRAYATNSTGTSYGIQRTFTTGTPVSAPAGYLIHDDQFVIQDDKIVILP